MLNILSRFLILLNLILYSNAFVNLNLKMNRFALKPLKTAIVAYDEFKNASNFTLMLKPKPIPIITFDEIFFNLLSINAVYISSNYDRYIFEYNNKKGVYYVENNRELKNIKFILSTIDIEKNIVAEYTQKMDNSYGSLYCMQKNNTQKHTASDVIHEYTRTEKIENSEDEFGEDEFYLY